MGRMMRKPTPTALLVKESAEQVESEAAGEAEEGRPKLKMMFVRAKGLRAASLVWSRDRLLSRA